MTAEVMLYPLIMILLLVPVVTVTAVVVSLLRFLFDKFCSKT